MLPHMSTSTSWGQDEEAKVKECFLGPEYDDETIKKAVQDSKFMAEYIGEDVNTVADLAAKGYIITWYQ